MFDLLPLVHVAWADGSIQPGERAAILRLLTVRGLGPGKAFTTMEALLEKRPSAEYLDESLEVLQELLEDKPREARTGGQACASWSPRRRAGCSTCSTRSRRKSAM